MVPSVFSDKMDWRAEKIFYNIVTKRVDKVTTGYTAINSANMSSLHHNVIVLEN